MTSIQRWVRFFRDAGIQDESAATYADNFFKNRMDMTMLMDLTKEYLNDLGIDTLGDVIKVTKHAKKVSEKINSDRILNDSTKEKEASPTAVVKTKKIRLKESTDPPPPAVKEESDDSPPPVRKRKLASVKQEQTEDVKPTSVKLEASGKVRLSTAPVVTEEKSSVFARLEAKKKNVFDRLEPVKVESDSIDVDSKKHTSRVVTTSGPPPSSSVVSTRPQASSRPPTASSKIIKLAKPKEEPVSAFDRLDSKADTQVPKVSSTNESTTPEPGKGILKQRGAGMIKSKSTSSIISLKSREKSPDLGAIVSGTRKRVIRVSFGGNDYRAVSPRQGIKTRLWGSSNVEEGGWAEVDTSDEDDKDELKDVKFNKRIQAAQVDDLRLNIKKKQLAKQEPDPSEVEAEKPKNIKVKVSNNVDETKSVVVKQARESDNDIVPTKKIQKKIFVIQSRSDGTCVKKEILPTDPLYSTYHSRATSGQSSKQEDGNNLASRLGPQQQQEETLHQVKPESRMASRLGPLETKRPAAASSVSSRLQSHQGGQEPEQRSLASRLEPRATVASEERLQLSVSSRLAADKREVHRVYSDSDNEDEREARRKRRSLTLSDEEEDGRRRRLPEDEENGGDRLPLGRRMLIQSSQRDMSSIQIHSDLRQGEYRTLEARAARISAEREEFTVSRTTVRGGQASARSAADRLEALRVTDQRFRVTLGDADIERRYEDEAIEREIAKKEQNISLIENRINKTISRAAISDSSLHSRSHRQEHKLPPLRYDESNHPAVNADDRRRGSGGTMIADREQKHRPAIEDRLSARQHLGRSQNNADDRPQTGEGSGRHGHRDRSRSPPMETSRRREDSGGSAGRGRREGESSWRGGGGSDSSRSKREEGARRRGSDSGEVKSSVRNRLGVKL